MRKSFARQMFHILPKHIEHLFCVLRQGKYGGVLQITNKQTSKIETKKNWEFSLNHGEEQKRLKLRNKIHRTNTFLDNQVVHKYSLSFFLRPVVVIRVDPTNKWVGTVQIDNIYCRP